MNGKVKRLMKAVLCILLVMTMGLSMPFSHLQNVLANENVEPQVSEAMQANTFVDKEKVYAEELEPTPGPSEQKVNEEAPEESMEPIVLGELEELRDVNKKYFEMSDGTTKVCIYPQNIHYLKEGEYEEIDNTLEYVEAESVEEEAVVESDKPIATENADKMQEETVEPTEVIAEETVEPTEVISEETIEPTEIISDETAKPTELPEEETEDVEDIQSEITDLETTPDVSDMINGSDKSLETEENEETEEIIINGDVEASELPADETGIIETKAPISEETEYPEEKNAETVLPSIIPEDAEESEKPELSIEELKEEAAEEKLSVEEKEAKRKLKNEKTKVKGSHYKNKSNSFEVLLPEDYSNDYTEFSDENGYVRFKLVGTSKVQVEKEKSEKLDRKDKTVAKNINSKASYKEIKKHVDIEYEVTGDMLKETIVLNKKTKDDFVFEVFTSSEDVRLNEDGSVDFYNENGEKLYTIGAPYMVDAVGEYSGKIEVSLEGKEDGYLLTYSPNEDWLYDKKREYPVRIDPTMIKALDKKEDIIDTYITSAQDGSAGEMRGYYDVINVGKRKDGLKLRGLIKFNIPSEIKPEDCIINAKLHLIHYFGGGESVSGTQIDVHELTKSFNEDNTWWGSNMTFDQYPVEYCMVDTSRTLSGDLGLTYDTYDITELANKWHSGSANNGLLLKLHDEDATLSSSKQVYYFAKQSLYYGDVTRYIEITYRNTVGLEDYWSYSSHSIGRAGTGYINMYNGNLVYVHDDVSNNTLINGFNLSHVYNNLIATDSAKQPVKNYYGIGFNLNLTQSLVPVAVTGNSKVKYVYTDGDGTKHYFIETDGKIVDEDGLGLTYSAIAENELKHKLTTKDGSVMKFDIWGDLRKIIDTNGNTISLNYTPIAEVDNYLNDITTSSGDTIDLVYDSNYKLTAIKDKKGRSIKYEYDGEKLSKITYPDGTYTQIQYNGNNIIRIREPGTSGVNYAQNSKGRMNIIDYVGDGGAAGNRDTFTYDHFKTTVTDKEGYKLTYLFDIAGRATSIYDSAGNIMTQKYNEESTAGNKIFSNNKTELDSSGTVYSNNLLANGTFSDDFSSWGKGNGSITIDSANALNTSKTVKIVNSSITTSVIYQMLGGFDSGSYTLSAYVKGNVTGGTSTGGIGIKIKTTEGREFISEMVKSTDDVNTDNGFTKVSTSVTLLSGEGLYSVEAGLFGASGTAYIDSIQLETGTTSGPVNLLQNSSFEVLASNSSTQPNKYTASSGAGGGRNANRKKDGTYALIMPGSASASKNYSQEIKTSGKKGDTYKFGCWGFAYSMPVHNDNKPYGMKFIFKNTDGTKTEEYAEFSTVVKDWQFASNLVMAKKDYSSITVQFYYNNNLNNAYFDSAYVYKDTAAAYTYDSNGNVISTADYAAGQSAFQYSNNALSKLVDPTGSGYEYYYDTKKNLIGAKDSSGTQTMFLNNAKGNPTDVRVTSSDSSAAIEDGEIYYIRLKGNGYYLTAKGEDYSSGINGQVFSGDTSQQWKVVQREGGYYTLHPQNATNQCIDVASGYNTEGASVVIYAVSSSGPGANQMFKIEPQNNYTYTLTPKHSTDNKKLTIKAVEGSTDVSLAAGSASDANSWYFEKVEDEPATEIVDGGIYRMRAYHSGKYVDVYNYGRTVGSKVLQYRLNYNKNQHFVFTKYGDTDYYTIAPLHATDCYLSVSEGDCANYAGYKYLSIGDSTITDKKLFKFEYDSSKRGFRIIPKSDETKALDVASYSNADMADLIFTTKAATVNRYFILEECSKEIKTWATYTSDNNYLSKVTDTRGKSTTYFYNGDTDLLDSVTDAKGVKTIYTYDPNNDRLLSVNTGSSTVSYGYNPNGSLSTITSPNSTKYNFEYDDYGRTKSTKVNNITLASYTYKNNYGSLLSRMDYGNGNYKTYTYDNLNRVTAETINGAQSKTYTYDKLGNLSKIYDAQKGATATYNYDLSGRITSYKDTINQKQGYVYDKYNRITDQSYSYAGSTINTEYIYGDNTVSGQETALLNKISYGDAYVQYDYDDLNRQSQIYYSINGANAGANFEYHNGSTKNFTSTLVSSMTLRYFTSYSISGLHQDKYEYAYDNVGNILSEKLNGTATATYTYDDLNQLKSVKRGSDTYTYAYDYNGNILSVMKNNSTYEKLYAYADTKWGDLLTSFNSETITYDAIGNPLKYRDGMTFTWENGRSLKSVLTPSGKTVYYNYDADGLRRGKMGNGDTVFYNYIDGTLMSERTLSEYTYYLYDENDSIVGFRLIDSSGSNTYLFQKNLQGDVIGILDDTGIQVATYTYDEWGKVLSIEGSDAEGIGAKNPIRYRGYYYDSETGFYYLGSRYYDPEIGRFINADLPETLTADFENINQYNLFAYCFNNPVNMSDETGTWPSWATKVIVGTAVIAVAAVLTVATAGTGTAIACFAVGALKGAAVGAAVGAASGAATGAIGHRISTGSWDGAGLAALEGAADGYMSGAISGFIAGGMTSNACFVAGTSVLTSSGHVAIETIKSGDYVWASEPETGEIAIKKVVETFVNQANELMHVTVNGEEIVCTNEHPFYSPIKGWIAACDLRAGDILVSVNGEYLIVELIQHEILETPILVYNFEVEDYHTYYVSDSDILVHNVCKNPGGRHGGNAHRSKVNNVKDDLVSKGWKVSARESRVSVGGGRYRYPDIIATKNNITRYYQIGRRTLSGRPISREIRALRDLGRTGRKVFFIPYN